jgi:hypothetical protein
LDRPDAVPLGLAAGVVCHPAAAGKLEKATGKLEERFLGGKSPDASLMQRWSTAATEVVRALRFTDPKAHRQTLQRTDEILSEVQGDGFAYLSDVSPIGFDQRLTRFGQRLSRVLEMEKGSGAFCPNGPEGASHKSRLAPGDLDALTEARQSVRDHDQSARETRRLERADMAVRLVRWLKESLVTGHSSLVTGQESNDKGQMTNDQGQLANPRSFADAAHAHLRDGGFVDWARLSLRSGDPVQGLSESYARLFDAATKLREQQAKQFAQLLADWTAAGSQSDEVIPIERVLEQIVAPLAGESPVLVIVIDGISVAVCRELLSDLTRHEWIAICEPGRNFNRPAVATLPSVTEFSRTSLLCGTLRQGGQEQEKAGFSEHPTLVARSRSGSPPVLFHKASLSESGDTVLATEVRKEIASTHRRVVGVVVNAVDDHLLKGEQIDTRWTRDEIRVLSPLLHEARIARRLVVLVSDHGHVLDCQTEGRPQPVEQSGERWRTAGGAPAEDELQVEGSRVLTQGHRLIAPWSERVRYGIKKNGYHGGLTPQEMVIPITVLSGTDDFPKGWSEQPIDTPVWWDEPSLEPVAEAQPAPRLKPFKPQPSGTLFDLEEALCHSSLVMGQSDGDQRPDVTVPEWVSRLLSCPVFEDQKRLGGRGVPSDKVFTQLLCALDQRGGKMTSPALARTLEFPALRLSGLLAKTQRVLNIDGYAVLSRDDASDTIELNRDLLLKQFDLVD